MAKYKSGLVTLPTDKDMDAKIMELKELWGADAIRNSDGTSLSDELLSSFEKVYATYLTTRADNAWGEAHPEEFSQIYLMTPHVTATDTTLDINLLDGYFEQEVQINRREDPARWWEVIDRTTGEVVPTACWRYDFDRGTVSIDTTPWHCYTVTFLAFQIWDAVGMYNHLLNGWGDKPHDMPYDVYNPKTRAYILDFLKNWLKNNPRPDVVRFTTFFYQFTLIYDNHAREKFVEWFGYSGSVNPRLLEDFEAEYGYRLRPEDIVRAGSHNGAFLPPTKHFLDYMDFVQRFVTKLARECVDLVHEAGKEAMMFFGDHWIGAEPYGKYFKDIGLDAIVGSVGDGVSCRMIADVPHVKTHEGRFLPYFFPDTFFEGGDPTGEANRNWLAARRSICRSPLQRMGYGGYLSLAVAFPDFVARVAEICDEFREIVDKIGDGKPYTPKCKVAILNHWGKARRWQTTMVAHAKIYKPFYPYYGIVEALCGMPIEVDFLSFDEIRENGIPEDVKVILNYGDAGSSWSGGDAWLDDKVLAAIRTFVHNGGGFIGVGEPTAADHQGRFFQLSDVLGVDKEIGKTLIYTRYNETSEAPHFITEDMPAQLDLGAGFVHNINTPGNRSVMPPVCGGTDSVYAVSESAVNLFVENGCTKLAAHTFGQGRSVYFAGLPYTAANTRLLLRAIYWSAGMEQALTSDWFSENLHTECNVYPETGWWCVLNNSELQQDTVVHKAGGRTESVLLPPMGIYWARVEA